jgi:outer membrane autotransporter protein
LLSGLLAAALAVPATAVSAQEFNEIQAVIKPQLNIERSRHLRRVLRERGEAALKRRMNPANTGGVAPLAYGEDDQVPIENAEPETLGWNVWIDGNGGRLEDSNMLRAYEGTQFVLSAGADKQIGDRLILGGIGVHFGNNIDNLFLPGTSSSRALGVGPYAAVFLTDTIVLTGSALHSWTDNKAASSGVTAAYDSRDWSLNANVTSYHFAGNWQFAPTVGASYSNENDDAYTDSSASVYAASATETGSLAAGGKASYTFALDNGVTIEPSLEIEGEWTLTRTTTATASIPTDMEEFDVNITAAADIAFNDRVSLSMVVTVSGLAKTDFTSWTGGGRLSVSF